MRNLSSNELDMVLGGSINGQDDPYSLDGNDCSMSNAARMCGSSGVKSFSRTTSTDNSRKGIGGSMKGINTKGQNDTTTESCEVECNSNDDGDSGSDSGGKDNDSNDDGGG